MLTKLSPSPTRYLYLLVALLITLNISSCQCKNSQEVTSSPVAPENSQEEETAVHKSVDLILTSNSGSQVKGSNNLVLLVKNRGVQASEPGKVKLKITRSKGSSATIVGATERESGYELVWPEAVPVNDPGITKNLNIDPGTDKQATFIFQIIYLQGNEEKKMGDPVSVEWEKGSQLLLKTIEYDITTRSIFYVLANEGSEPVRGVKFHYECKTADVKVEGNLLTEVQETHIGDLEGEAPEVSKKIGYIDFGENQHIHFDFWLSYIGGPSQFAKQSIRFAANKPLNLTATSPKTKLIGSEAFHLTITNRGDKPSEPGKLKLKINRIIGNSATIMGASERELGSYELSLPESIPVDEQGITKALTIHPGMDKQAVFICQLVYPEKGQERLIGEVLAVNWEKGAPLLIQDITYDKSTGDILYSVVNQSEQRIEGIKLNYACKNSGVKVDSDLLNLNEVKLVSLGSLATGAQVLNKKLGKLNFGGNQHVEFDFWLSYPDSPNECTKKSRTFTAVDIQLAIHNLYHDTERNSIIYNILNKGKDTARHAKLRYLNISQDEVGKTVLLGSKKEDTLSLKDIDGENVSEEQSLAIDFKSATKATFRFEVLYDGIAVDSLDIETKLPNLRLVPLTSSFIVGSNRTIQFKLKEANDFPIEVSNLKLLITKSADSDIKIYYQGAEVREELLGTKVDDITQPLQFTIDPGTAKKASLDFQLLYLGTAMGGVKTFTWEAAISKDTKKLFRAISQWSLETINLLSNNKEIQINAADEKGQPPLWKAMLAGNEPAMLTLLKNPDIDVNAQGSDNPSGYTLLHLAVQQGSKAVIAALLTKDVEVNARVNDVIGHTALHLAVFDNNQEAIELLLQSPHIDPSATDKLGESPLHLAVRKSNQAVIEKLLKKRANVNEPDSFGNTPLHVAVKEGDKDVIRLLVAKDANLDLPNKEGETPRNLFFRLYGPGD